ncbi:hypothetical protein ACTMTF_44530 [Nonomuraea sp. ZG12]
MRRHGIRTLLRYLSEPTLREQITACAVPKRRILLLSWAFAG